MLSVVLSMLTERSLQPPAWNVFLAPALSCSSRETLLRKYMMWMSMNAGREVSKPSVFSSGQSDSFLLTAIKCNFLSFLGLSPYRNFLAGGPLKKLCSLQLFLYAMLLREIAKQLVPSQPIRQTVVHCVEPFRAHP